MDIDTDFDIEVDIDREIWYEYSKKQMRQEFLSSWLRNSSAL